MFSDLRIMNFISHMKLPPRERVLLIGLISFLSPNCCNLYTINSALNSRPNLRKNLNLSSDFYKNYSHRGKIMRKFVYDYSRNVKIKSRFLKLKKIFLMRKTFKKPTFLSLKNRSLFSGYMNSYNQIFA